MRKFLVLHREFTKDPILVRIKDILFVDASPSKGIVMLTSGRTLFTEERADEIDKLIYLREQT